MNVLVINQWSTNKGDRAVCYFLLKALADNGITDVTVSTHDPAYWRKYPDFPEDITPKVVSTAWQILPKWGRGIGGKIWTRINYELARRIAFPLVRRALLTNRIGGYIRFLCNRDYYQAVKRADVVISTGGHRVTTINTPDAVGPQMYDLALATLLGKPPILWSQSIGPFSFASELNRQLVKKVLDRSPAVYIRNAASADEIEKVGSSPERVIKTHESVFGLYTDDPERRKPSEREKRVGVSVYVTNKRTPQVYREYVNTMTGLVNHAIARGYKIVFFPMELRGADRRCIEDIVQGSQNPDACSIEGFPPTMEHIRKVSRCQAFVGHKTHSVIFSLVSLTPLVAVSYHAKTHDFMKECGLEEYCVSDAEFGAQRGEIFDMNKVTDILDRVIRQGDEIYLKQSQVIPGLAQKVQNDFAVLIEKAKQNLIE